MRNRWKTAVRKACAVLCAAAAVSMVPAGNVQAVGAGSAISQGIDVSQHNGAVNWSQVAGTGMKFTFIKAGSTKSGMDPQFVANITGAQAAGLKTGVYLYSYAVTPEQAAEEARLILEWIAPYTVNYPVVFDIEDKCHKDLTEQQLIDIINTFCFAVDAAGYYPMVYSSKNMFNGKLSITGWDKWVAQYNDSCEYDNNVCFWQYSSQGNVNGVSGRVDVNYQYKDYSSLIVQDGFVGHNGSVRFYQNWKMQKGWIDYNGTRYYLDGAGNLVSGWLTDVSGSTYFLSPQDGSIARGQCVVDGADYYFTAEGVRTLGWVTIEDRKYFYDPANNGIMKRQWYSDESGNTYFFDPADGHMLTGIYEMEGQLYCFGENGALVKNQTIDINGTPYNAGPEGILVPAPLAEPAAPTEQTASAEPAAPAENA